MSDFSFALKSKQKPKLIKIQKIMEKERKITAPEGCEIEKVELVDGVAVVTFKEKDYKKGDFVVTCKGCIGIIDKKHDDGDYFLYCRLIDDEMYNENEVHEYSRRILRFATENEKQKLLKAIDNKGYEWDAEKLELRKKERKLPKTWDEFCEIYPLTAYETYIDKDSMIEPAFVNTDYSHDRNIRLDKNVLPNHATAEAVLALCQLIQLCNAYNGDWVPDYKTADTKFTIEFDNNRIVKNTTKGWPCILTFKSEELRDEFLRNFRPIIEKLKPLYGIKEGGEE